MPARLRTALEELQPECVIAGCHIDRHLEIDHNVPVTERGPTALWNLSRLCHHHHDTKTRKKIQVVGEGLHKTLIPGGPRSAGRARPEIAVDRSVRRSARGTPREDAEREQQHRKDRGVSATQARLPDGRQYQIRYRPDARSTTNTNPCAITVHRVTASAGVP